MGALWPESKGLELSCLFNVGETLWTFFFFLLSVFLSPEFHASCVGCGAFDSAGTPVSGLTMATGGPGLYGGSRPGVTQGLDVDSLDIAGEAP